jgi:hypothetical protein
MGGSESKQEQNTKIREQISTELSMKIENVNKNLNKTVTDVTTNISNKVVNEAKNSPEARALATNLLEDIFVIASGGTNVEIKQDADAQIEMAAIVQMLTDNTIKNQAATNLVQDITNKLQQDAAMKAELVEAARIEEKSKEAKGFANMVENLTKVASDVIGGIAGSSTQSVSNTDIEKEVRTKINNEISNVNINENEVINKVATTVKNEFLNLTVDECLGSASSRNHARKLNLIGEEGSSIIISQVAKTQAVVKCMVNRGIGNASFSGVTSDSAFKAASEAAQTAKSDGSLSKKTEQIKTTETTDAIADTVQQGIKSIENVASKGLDIFGNFTMLLPMIIGVVGVIFVIIILFMFMGGGSSDSGNYYSDEDMEGGFMYNNFFNQEGGAIAIFTLQRAIILVAIMGGIDYIIKQFNK